MPRRDGVALNQQERRGPVPPDVAQHEPEETVGRLQAWTLRRHAISQTRPALLIARNTRPCVMAAGGSPCVDVALHPGRDGNGSHVSALADQIRDHPMLLALLNRFELQS